MTLALLVNSNRLVMPGLQISFEQEVLVFFKSQRQGAEYESQGKATKEHRPWINRQTPLSPERAELKR